MKNSTDDPAKKTPLPNNEVKEDAPPLSLAERIRPLILFVLIILLIGFFAALSVALPDYMFICRIPAGTRVVDSTMAPTRSPLGELIYKSGVLNQLNCDWIREYLHYRYYVIPDGVEEIGDSAFMHAVYDMRGVSIPGSVKKIGRVAFAGNTALGEIVIPDGVETIGEAAFGRCQQLTSVRIPDSVREIGSRAFANCTALKEIRLPAGLAGTKTGLGDRAFAHCTSLRKVTIPDGIPAIGDSVFRGCYDLCEINIPDSVTSIGPLAFQGCFKLPPVTLGRQVTDIGGGAFAGTGCRLTVPDDHPTVRLEDGILYSKDRSTLIFCVSAPENGTCIVAPETKIIQRGAFSGCDGLTDIRLPEGLEIISDEAFRGCAGLSRIELPDSLKEIGREAFRGCLRLEEIVIPPGVTDVKEGTFYECRSLKRAVLSGKMGRIPPNMFSFCTRLEEVAIPEGITEIDKEAFYDCRSLKRVTVPDSLENVVRNAFPSRNELRSLDQETWDQLEKRMPPLPPGLILYW